MNIKDRRALRGKSNNQSNPNQNLCTQAVARSLGVENATRYLHTIHDLDPGSPAV